MKLAFIFDVRFKKYNNDYYSINLSDAFWNRKYLPYFEEIIVVGRYVNVNEDPSGKLLKSNTDRVHFCCIEDPSTLKRILSQKEQEEFIIRAIKDCDRVICRGWWGASACKKLGKTYMIEVVACAWNAYWNHSLMGKIVALPNYILQRRAIWEAPFVIYVTQKFLQRRYPTKGYNIGVSDVELWVSDDLSYISRVLERRRKRISSSHKRFIIGTAGAIDIKYKGQSNIIKAIYLLRQRGIDLFEYQLAGSGDKEYLEKVASKYGMNDRVTFLGSIPHEDLIDWYDNIDIYIQPSLTEGLPRALIEAMSRGLPCFGTRVGGIPELLDDKYTCEKRRNLAEQFSKLLETVREEDMIVMAEKNILVSKQYTEETLAIRREIIMQRFCCNEVDED